MGENTAIDSGPTGQVNWTGAPSSTVSTGPVSRDLKVPDAVERPKIVEALTMADKEIDRAETFLASKSAAANRYVALHNTYALGRTYIFRAQLVFSQEKDPEKAREAYKGYISKAAEHLSKVPSDFVYYPAAQIELAQAYFSLCQVEQDRGAREVSLKKAIDVCEKLSLFLSNRKNLRKIEILHGEEAGYLARAQLIMGNSYSALGKNKTEAEACYKKSIEYLNKRYDASLCSEAHLGLGEISLSGYISEKHYQDPKYFDAAIKDLALALNGGRPLPKGTDSIDYIISNLNKIVETTPEKDQPPMASRSDVLDVFGTDDSWQQFFYDGSWKQYLLEHRWADREYDQKSIKIEFRPNAKEMIRGSSLPEDKKEFLLSAINDANPVFVSRAQIEKMFSEFGDSWKRLFNDPDKTTLQFRHDASDVIMTLEISDNDKLKLQEMLMRKGIASTRNMIQQIAYDKKINEDVLLRAFLDIAKMLSVSEKTDKANAIYDFVLNYPFIENKPIFYASAVIGRAGNEIAKAQECADRLPDETDNVKKEETIKQISQHILNASMLNGHADHFISLKKHPIPWFKTEVLENYVKLLNVCYSIDPKYRRERSGLVDANISPTLCFSDFNWVLNRGKYDKLCGYLLEKKIIEDPDTNGTGIRSLLNEKVFSLTISSELNLNDLSSADFMDDTERAKVLDIINEHQRNFSLLFKPVAVASEDPIFNALMQKDISDPFETIRSKFFGTGPDLLAAKDKSENRVESLFNGLQDQLDEAQKALDPASSSVPEYRQAMIMQAKTQMIEEQILNAATHKIADLEYAYGALLEMRANKAIEKYDDPKYNNPWLQTNNYMALAHCCMQIAFNENEPLPDGLLSSLNTGLGCTINKESGKLADNGLLTDAGKVDLIASAIERYLKPAVSHLINCYGKDYSISANVITSSGQDTFFTEAETVIGTLTEKMNAGTERTAEFNRKALRNINDIFDLASNEAAKGYYNLALAENAPKDKTDYLNLAKSLAYKTIVRHPEDSKDACIIYANCAAQDAILTLASSDTAGAIDKINACFDVEEKTGNVTIKIKGSDGKDTPRPLPNTMDTVDARLMIANVMLAAPLQDTIKRSTLPADYQKTRQTAFNKIFNIDRPGNTELLSIKDDVANGTIETELSDLPEGSLELIRKANSNRTTKIKADLLLDGIISAYKSSIEDARTTQNEKEVMINKLADALSVQINLRIAQNRIPEALGNFNIFEDTLQIKLGDKSYEVSDVFTAQKVMFAIMNSWANYGVSEHMSETDELIDFCDANKGKYRYDNTSNMLVVIGEMSKKEKADLQALCPNKEDKEAIERLYNARAISKIWDSRIKESSSSNFAKNSSMEISRKLEQMFAPK